MSDPTACPGSGDRVRVMVTLQHPAHVHFYRHAVRELRERGHDVWVFARDKDLTGDLLAAYDIDHRVLAELSGSLPRRVVVQATWEYRLLRWARRLDPDVVTAVGGLAASHVGALTGARSVVFTDSEGAPSNYLTMPFADAVCTPRALDVDYGPAHRRYDGFHELAYLHPARFTPDDSLLRAHGVDPDDRFFLLRFVAWDASHDVGQRGLTRAHKRELVDRLAAHGDVYVTTEGPLPPAFRSHALPVPPEHVHHLLARASGFVGDSGTMATEAAVLGVPAVRTNSVAGPDDLAVFRRLADRYGLLVSTADPDEAVETAVSLAADPDAPARWRRRRERLLAETVDVTAYVVDTLLEEGERGRRPVADRVRRLVSTTDRPP